MTEVDKETQHVFKILFVSLIFSHVKKMYHENGDINRGWPKYGLDNSNAGIVLPHSSSISAKLCMASSSSHD